MVTTPPAGMVPREQVKLGLPEQDPWEGVTVPLENPAGQVSDRVTAWASEGPELVTVMVEVPELDPAVTVLTPSVLVTDRSASATTVTSAVLESTSPSVSSEEAWAVLDTVSGATLAATV